MRYELLDAIQYMIAQSETYLTGECAVEVHNPLRVTFVHNFKLADNAAPGLWVSFKMNHLLVVRQ